MTADPSRVPERPYGWYVATNQGVVLRGPFGTRAAAVDAYLGVVEELRRDLMRDRRPGEFIAGRIRAVQVAYGRTAGAWGGFEPAP